MKKEVLNNSAVTLRVAEDGVVDTVLGAAETVSDITEQAIDTVGQTLDILEERVEDVVTVTKNNPVLIGGALVVGLVVGGVVAYRIGVKRTTLKYEEIIEVEVERARSFHARLAKTEMPTPEAAVQALHPELVTPEQAGDATLEYQGRASQERVPYNRVREIQRGEDIQDEATATAPVAEVIVEKETVVVERSVFDPGGALNPQDWDYERELAQRDVTKPYVISFEEFTEGDGDGYDNVTLSYYAEDDVLCDMRDVPVEDTESIVGDDNLARFGPGSGSHDPNTLYIRNEKIETNFEIVRSPGSYSKEVLGHNPDDSVIRHSRMSKGRRFREDRE